MRAEDHLTPPTGKHFVVELENEAGLSSPGLEFEGIDTIQLVTYGADLFTCPPNRYHCCIACSPG